MTIAAPLRFGGRQLGPPRHICAFFSSDDEAYRVLLPFIQEGFSCGEKAVHVLNPGRRGDHLARLASVGIDTTSAEQRGQLELRSNAETYLRDGHFDPDEMLGVFERLASGSGRGGFPLSRIVCHMDWAEGAPTIDLLVEFEARVDALWRRHGDAVVCVYPLDRFGGEAVIDIVRTHPLVVIGGLLHENPFFEPPEQFLRELRARRARRPATARVA